MADAFVRASISMLANFLSVNLPVTNNIPLSANQITNVLNSFNALNPNNALTLSALKPDYESNNAELQSILLNSSNPIWTDAIVAGVGAMLIRCIATAETYNTFAAITAAREAIIATAQLANSIYADTRFLGMRIQRRVPGQVPITLTRSANITSSYTIPSYSQFSLAGANYFNRTQLTFAAGQDTINDFLYEGQVNNITVISTGNAYQIFVVGNYDFTISDTDVICQVNGTIWTATETDNNISDGLWELGPNDTNFSEDTTIDGNVEISFGNNITGAIPPVGLPIVITYVRTNGINGNAILTGQSITLSTDSTISGTATGPTINGLDARQPTEYKILSPGKFSSKKRFSTLPDHVARTFDYPGGGIIDCYWRNQQLIAPNDIRYMMVMEVTLLTLTPWTLAQQQAFAAWYAVNGIANMRLIFRQASPYLVNIDVDVYCLDQPALSTLEANINANLNAIFQLQAGVLGKTTRKFDIENAIKQTDTTQIVSLTLNTPIRDIVLQPYQYAVLNTLTLNLLKD